jgi:hypothetical protein
MEPGMTVYFDLAGAVDPAIANLRFPPVADGCVGFWDLGADAAVSVRNLVNPSAPAVVVGSPTWGASGMGAGETAGLSLGNLDTAAHTRFVVARWDASPSPPSGGARSLIGNWVSGQGGAMLRVFVASETWRLGTTGLSAAPAVTLTGANLTQWAVFGYRVSSSAARTRDFSRGFTSTSLSITTYTPPSPARSVTVPIIGGGQSQAMTVSYIAAYNRALSDAEENTVAAWLAGLATGEKGLTLAAPA